MLFKLLQKQPGKMEQPKMNGVTELATPGGSKTQKDWIKFECFLTLCRVLLCASYLTFIVPFSVKMFSLITDGNLGTCFLEASRKFNFNDAIGLNLEPIINFLLWLSVTELVWDVLRHANILFHLVIKINKPINLSDGVFVPGAEYKWIIHNIILALIDGLVLWRMYTFYIYLGPVVYMLTFHLGSALMFDVCLQRKGKQGDSKNALEISTDKLVAVSSS